MRQNRIERGTGPWRAQRGFSLQRLVKASVAAALICPGMAAAQEPTQEQAPWLQLVAACEEVIDSQRADAFRALPSAPFNVGTPSYKEYGYYDASRTLVMVATKSRGAWTSCVIREAVEEDRERFRYLAEVWTSALEHAFPATDYQHRRFVGIPSRPFPIAVRCREAKRPLVITPTLIRQAFRVDVYEGPSRMNEGLCQPE